MRGLLIGLLAFGTLAGFASGFHHLRSNWHGQCAWEQRAPPPPPAPCTPAAP